MVIEFLENYLGLVWDPKFKYDATLLCQLDLNKIIFTYYLQSKFSNNCLFFKILTGDEVKRSFLKNINRLFFIFAYNFFGNVNLRVINLKYKM